MAAGSWAEDQVCPGLEGAGIRVCAEANRLAGPGHRPWLGNLAPHGHGETSVSNRLAPCRGLSCTQPSTCCSGAEPWPCPEHPCGLLSHRPGRRSTPGPGSPPSPTRFPPPGSPQQDIRVPIPAPGPLRGADWPAAVGTRRHEASGFIGGPRQTMPSGPVPLPRLETWEDTT